MKPPLRSVRASPRAGLVRRPAVASAGRQVIRGLVSDTVSAAAELQSSNIRVAVRVRPFNDKETQVNTRYVINFKYILTVLLNYFSGLCLGLL